MVSAAVGLRRGRMGPVSPWSWQWNTRIMALQRAEDFMQAVVFKLPGDLGVLNFKDNSFFGGKDPLSSKNQACSSFHNA